MTEPHDGPRGGRRPRPALGPHAPNRRIDLHTHSTASDGTLSPAELVARRGRRRSRRAGDHRPRHHRRLGARPSRRCRPGLDAGPRRRAVLPVVRRRPAIPLHLLAYLFDPDGARTLVAELARVRAAAGAARANGSSTLLRADGIDVSWAGDPGQRGRRHGRPAAHRPGADPGRPGREHRRGVRPDLAGRAVPVAQGRHRRVRGGPAGPGGRRRAGLRPSPGQPSGAGCVPDELIVELAAAGPVRAGGRPRGPLARPSGRTCGRSPAELGLVVTGSSDFHGTHKTVRLGAFTTAPRRTSGSSPRPPA